jgi:hypothetical protein
MLNSFFLNLGLVRLPENKGRQMYMHTFDASAPAMAVGYEDYLDPVSALLKAAGVTQGAVHMTVDEKEIAPGMSQRRPGPHVDGCFYPEAQHWGHGGGGGWNHYCNNIEASPVPRMAVIVASDVPGCRAWAGDFDGAPSKCGDLSHIQDQLGEGVVLPPNAGYWLSPDCVHESMIFDKPTRRTFLRIALPLHSAPPQVAAQ